ncbi:hypothetical protein VHEMI03949 [[Torrubiella] hemipterigena]|uniref:Uncharacterized protein n=1 Tax=[Torrubiella] hemipterigena TaxID=1531966 RepID=A0A0A1STY1_9HYPO|nr:hypothetical protein VHEMI03949 [[Torrubiella] hemipterigena]
MGLFKRYTEKELASFSREERRTMGLKKFEEEEADEERRREEELKPSSAKTNTMELLSSPLPADLPPCDKNVMICMAAYYGDIDPYNRLRRPYLIGNEMECVVRGIYHNTQFAVWWSKQLSHAGIPAIGSGQPFMPDLL